MKTQERPDYGLLRVATAIPTVRIADVGHNVAQHIDIIGRAREEEVQLLVFPELSVTGYTCADLFRQPALLRAAGEALRRLADATRDAGGMLVVVGAPVAHGGRIYNCAVALQDGAVRLAVPKLYLPNYNEFYEARWFASGAELPAGAEAEAGGMTFPLSATHLLRLGGATVGIEVCEDLWVPRPPSAALALAGAEVIVNLSASNEVLGKHAYLRRMIEAHSGRLVAAYVYASCGFGESSTDLVFAGKGLVAENGGILAESPRFLTEAQLLTADVDVEKLQTLRRGQTTFTQLPSSPAAAAAFRTVCLAAPAVPDFERSLRRAVTPHPFVPSDEGEMTARCEEIFSIQVAGLVQRLHHIQARTAVIGISGGLDSTLALLVTARAFDRLGWDRRRIVGITMPGFGTTDRTHRNSLGLMASLGITQREISIVPSVTQHFADLGIDASVHDVTYENCQARERTQILMDEANRTGGIVIGTGDLSELALGWCTYNGDHMSMYAVNVSIPKTLVKYLVRWVALTAVDEDARRILLDVVDTPISPELTPPDADGKIAQRTEDLVGPYELHDFFLYHFFRFGASPAKIDFLARKAFGTQFAPDGTVAREARYDAPVIRRWLREFFRRFFQQQFKRSCIPDGPKVGTVSLSPRGDWRMPSDATAALWLAECDSLNDNNTTT